MQLNRVLLCGNLTHDPELRSTPSGHTVVHFRLAVNEKVGEREDTLFIDCTAWNKTAENIHKYMRKGSELLIEGRLRLEQWQDRETGVNRSKIVANVDRAQFGAKPKDEGEARQPTASAPRSQPAAATSSADDLPF